MASALAELVHHGEADLGPLAAHGALLLAADSHFARKGRLVEHIQTGLDRDTAGLVLLVGVAHDELAHNVHGVFGGIAQGVALKHATQQHRGEDVARTGEVHGHLVEGNGEVLARLGVVTHHGVDVVHLGARDDHRLRTQATHGIHQRRCTLGGESVLHVDGRASQQTCLSVVGHRDVCLCHEPAHEGNRALGHAGIQRAVVAHDGVDEHAHALGRLALAELGDDAGLLLGHDEAGGHRVKREAQLVPDGQRLLYVVGRVVDEEVGVVERVGHEGRGQVVQTESHVRQHRHHGAQGHLAKAAHVVDEQDVHGLRYSRHRAFLHTFVSPSRQARNRGNGSAAQPRTPPATSPHTRITCRLHEGAGICVQKAAAGQIFVSGNHTSSTIARVEVTRAREENRRDRLAGSIGQIDQELYTGTACADCSRGGQYG